MNKESSNLDVADEPLLPMSNFSKERLGYFSPAHVFGTQKR